MVGPSCLGQLANLGKLHGPTIPPSNLVQPIIPLCSIWLAQVAEIKIHGPTCKQLGATNWASQH